MRKVIHIIVGLIVAFSCQNVIAQNVKVQEQLDSLEIVMGDQCHLFLTVTAKKTADVQVPDYTKNKNITPGIEVVEIAKADSVNLDDDMLEQTIVYTLTSFEPKVQYIPPISVMVDGKKYDGQKLALKVLDVPVDTTKMDQFYPAKDVQTNPFSWDEWIPLIILYGLASALAVFAMLCWLMKKANKPIRISFRMVKRVPAHVKAMEEIDSLKAQHLAIDGDQKEYYSQLTDTLRHYLEQRFGFSAMEMTTSEIIARLQDENPMKVAELRELFETADLVKFAKYSTNDNDRNLLSAIDFINSTKTEEVVEEHKEETQLSDDERQINTAHKVFHWAIVISVVAITAILTYIIWQIVGLIE